MEFKVSAPGQVIARRPLEFTFGRFTLMSVKAEGIMGMGILAYKNFNPETRPSVVFDARTRRMRVFEECNQNEKAGNAVDMKGLALPWQAARRNAYQMLPQLLFRTLAANDDALAWMRELAKKQVSDYMDESSNVKISLATLQCLEAQLLFIRSIAVARALFYAAAYENKKPEMPDGHNANLIVKYGKETMIAACNLWGLAENGMDPLELTRPAGLELELPLPYVKRVNALLRLPADLPSAMME
jgi:hypothetical protein